VAFIQNQSAPGQTKESKTKLRHYRNLQPRKIRPGLNPWGIGSINVSERFIN
jgi:hypothetical protein